MWENMKFKSSNGSGSLAAAAMVFSIGLVGCAVFASLAFRDRPHIPMILLATLGALAIIGITLKARPDLPSSALWLFSRGRKAGDGEYVPKPIKTKPTVFGTHAPPTVDDVRELKETPRYWVPSGTRRIS